MAVKQDNLIIPPELIPDIKFSLFDVENHKYIGDYSNLYNPKQKSTGSVQTILELGWLMNKSLAIVSPNLLFTPDFPDYLLSEDHPNYIKTVPTMDVETNKKMPHHRNDMWQHCYESYPGLEKVPIPHITWGLVRQEPGTMGKTAFASPQERKPRIREYVAVVDENQLINMGMNSDILGRNLNYLISIEGQSYDNLVQYNMWARSAFEVEELKEWFQIYMQEYVGLYREAGIVQMMYERAVRDDILMQRKNGYHLRSLLYYIRTERIHIHTVSSIKRIDTNILMANSSDEIKYNNNLDDIIVSQDRLLSKWHNNST